MLLRNPVWGTVGFRGSNVVSASDFSPSLNSLSAIMSSFSVSKPWSPAVPESHPFKFKSSLPTAGIDYVWLNMGNVARLDNLDAATLDNQAWVQCPSFP